MAEPPGPDVEMIEAAEAALHFVGQAWRETGRPQLKSVLDRLEDDLGDVLHLLYYDGLSETQVAKILASTPAKITDLCEKVIGYLLILRDRRTGAAAPPAPGPRRRTPDPRTPRGTYPGGQQPIWTRGFRVEKIRACRRAPPDRE